VNRYLKKSTNVRTVSAQILRDGFRSLERLSPALAATGAEELFRTPRRPPRPSRERALLARAEPFELSVRGEPIAAWSWGQGAPVVLVHGWQGRGAQLGAFVDPLVGSGHRVIAFDVHAHGSSGGRQATLVEFKDALIATAERVGPLKGVVAHSFGAAAVWSALSGGVSADRLVLIAPVARLEDGIRRFAQGMLGLHPKTADRIVDRIERRTESALPSVEPLELAPRSGAEVLIVHDRKDREVPFSDGEALLRACRSGRMLATDGLGHTRVLADRRIAEIASAFMSGNTDELEALLEWQMLKGEDLKLDRFLFRRDLRDVAYVA
jgi:pimeloyl-ACP methyl ester carboxylesterase